MGKNNNEETAALYLFILVVGVVLLYFLSKLLFFIGIFGVIVGIVLAVIGISQREDNIILIGVIIFVVSFLLIIVGATGINFFERSEIGSQLLESSNDIINTTKELHQVQSGINSQIEREIIGAIG